jgi:hypothetical protein
MPLPSIHAIHSFIHISLLSLTGTATVNTVKLFYQKAASKHRLPNFFVPMENR